MGGGSATGGGSPTCTDDDGDGYVAGAGCSGLPGGDCAPRDATVNPGQGERCTNGKDDDCDGLVDAADADCGPGTCVGAPSCQTAWNCGVGTSRCHQGCCVSCAVPPQPVCPMECPLTTTIEPLTGCPVAAGCAPCFSQFCAPLFAPVCGSTTPRFLDPRTFSNACEAGKVGASIIHVGACDTGEGLDCSAGMTPGCGPGTELYCRDACPECVAEMRRCTRKGVCLLDADCPAGLAPPPVLTCASGAPSALRCVSNACVPRCP